MRDIAARGGRAAALVCDVTEGESVAATVAAAEAALGPVDILVNNAGIAISKPMLEHTEEEWDRVVDTNLKGAWLMSRALAERWVRTGRRGRIINIASLLALRPIRHVPSYCAAKAGLAHLTHTMAMELARKGITVNAIAPGYFETDMNRDFLRSEVGQALISRIPDGPLGRILRSRRRAAAARVRRRSLHHRRGAPRRWRSCGRGCVRLDDMRTALAKFLAEATGARSVAIEELRLLSTGAVQENWLVAAAFEGGVLGGQQQLVLRTERRDRARHWARAHRGVRGAGCRPPRRRCRGRAAAALRQRGHHRQALLCHALAAR